MALERELSFNLGLPVAPLTENLELYHELLRIYNAVRTLAYRVDSATGSIAPIDTSIPNTGPDGILINNHTKVWVKAYEDLVVGNTVQFISDAGTWKARKAVSATRKARGFVSVAGVTGEYVEVTLIGLYPSFSAGTLTPGTTYYQSTTEGVIGAAGFQAVGFAISDTQLFFNPDL